MAESLKLVGFKRVEDHSPEAALAALTLVPPPQGNVHFFPKWWDRKANQKIYISGAKFAIEGSPYELLIPCTFGTRLRIQYDGDPLALILSEQSQVERVGVYDTATGVVVFEYVAPRVKARNAKWFSKVLDQDTIDGNTPAPPPPADPCDGVVCPPGEHCENGVCVPD
jgi:hypothetical protein